MLGKFSLLSFGLLVLALYKAISRHSHARKVRELGCQEAVRYLNSGFLGLKGLRELQKANDEYRLPEYLLERQDRMETAYGRYCATFETPVLGKKAYFTCDPRNIQAMLSQQFSDFEFGANRRAAAVRPLLGDSLFSLDGEEWKHSRSALRLTLTRQRVTDVGILEGHLHDILSGISGDSDGWTGEIEMSDLFGRITTDTMADFIFGNRFGVVENSIGNNTSQTAISEEYDYSTHTKKTLVTHLFNALHHVGVRVRLGGLFWLYNPKDFRESVSFVQRYLTRHITREMKAGEKTLTTSGGDTENLPFIQAMTQRMRDPKKTQDSLITLYAASRDPLADSVVWILHDLFRHPACYSKLREAVIRDLGTYTNPKKMDDQALKSCKYLQYVFHESGRLHTVVPFNVRTTNKPTTLPYGGGQLGESPIYLEAGTSVAFSSHVIHRRRDIWGDDANEYRPERFEHSELDWNYLPFSRGPRICLGQQLASIYVTYMLARLVQRFDQVSPRQEDLLGPVRSHLGVTSAIADPVYGKFHIASD